MRGFYNRHPYPPPVADLDAYHQRWRENERLRVDYHLLWPTRPYREDLDILVAGCGTSQAAKHAIRQPAARVIGIDISETSLEHTRSLKRKYGLANLEVYQLGLEDAVELDQSFDKIVCTGVLHHLLDPEAGLRALHSVMKPDGAMQLMVYAAYGRSGIAMMQTYCRLLGIEATDAEIDNLLAVLKELPSGHPLDYLLRKSPDFRHPDALADALLNPRERAYTVPQVFDLLKNCELAFGRWQRQAPYTPQCGVIATTPHGARLAHLTQYDQYTEMELFRGTITHHSFIAYRQDCAADLQPIRFDGEDWLQYIPMQHPAVLCVQQRLPPGVAAVLINQEHTDTDLVNSCDVHEKRLFDAIDGKRSISEILHNPPTSKGRRQHIQRGHAFFQRLWLYDHVVFDASR